MLPWPAVTDTKALQPSASRRAPSRAIDCRLRFFFRTVQPPVSPPVNGQRCFHVPPHHSSPIALSSHFLPSTRSRTRIRRSQPASSGFRKRRSSERGAREVAEAQKLHAARSRARCRTRAIAILVPACRTTACRVSGHEGVAETRRRRDPRAHGTTSMGKRRHSEGGSGTATRTCSSGVVLAAGVSAP